MLISILFAEVWLVSTMAMASSPRVTHAVEAKTGLVCAGPNLSPVLTNQKIFVKVGGLSATPLDKWQLVAKDLDLSKNHRVVIYADATPLESWFLNFKKLDANFVIVWKAYGSWKMQAVKGETCSL